MTREGRRPSFAALVVLCASLAVVPADAAPITGLTRPDAIARALNLAYDADFAGADQELVRACAVVATPACETAKAVLLWWRIFMDPENRSRDQAFLRQADWSIALADQWAAREPERAEAWFYVGAAYGARVQFRVQRREYLAAARDGKRIKAALERALVLDPAMHDANFGIGLYQYYADIAPAVLKFLRWLMALPGGDRDKGMAQMLRTRDAGILMKTEAAYQLYLIDIWYENRWDRGLESLQVLRARHPHSPLFALNIAQLHEIYRDDRPAARAVYQSLIDGAAEGAFREPALAGLWGRRGVATQLDALGETDRAIEILSAVVVARPTAPYGALALSQFELGRAYDRLGRREQATDAYRAALAAVPAGDPDDVRRRAERGLRQAPSRAQTDSYRASLEGWRAFERGRLAEAGAALDRALQLQTQDGMALCRRGLVWLARQDPARAVADFERALTVRPRPPAPFVARCHLEAGHVYRAAGDRVRAAAHYEQAARVRGADAGTTEAARNARASLTP